MFNDPKRESEEERIIREKNERKLGRDERTLERDTETLELREEELEARKRSVETGQVRIGKDVVEERRTLEVPVTREEVFIERHPVDRQAVDGGTIGDSRETLRVPVHEEQVSVDKRAVVTEEIEVGKRQVQENQQVSGTIRREEAVIRKEGDLNVEEDRRR